MFLMKTDIKQIRDLIDSAKNVLTRININYNSEIGPQTNKLIGITRQIIPIIKTDHPKIAEILEHAVNTIVNRQSVPTYPYGLNVVKNLINAYSFGDIRTAIKILDAIYTNEVFNSRKVFISHSSKDKDIILSFTDHILQLGIGIDAQDIFCTSIEDLGIKNGEDIRSHIKTNIQTADFAFLMISNNYKQSEICLNEMGAVWTYNNNVRYYLLPETKIDSIGWLCDPKKADAIDSPITLDAIHQELKEYYQLPYNGIEWSRHRQTFLDFIANNK